MKQNFLAGLSAKGLVLKTWLMVCLFLFVGGGNIAWAEDFKGSFTKITSTEGLVLGDYYVLYGINGNYKNAMAASISNGRLGSIAVTPSSDVITDPDATCVWKLGGTSTCYTLYNEATGKYVEINTGSTSGYSLVASQSTVNSKKSGYSVTVTSGDWSFKSTTQTSYFISIYQNDWRPYTSSNKKTLNLYHYATPSGIAVEKPTNLSAGTPTSTGTTLSWNAVDHATAYKVEYKVSTAGSWTTVNPNPTTASCELTGLTPSTTYAWQVTALSTETGYKDGSAQAGANFTTAAPASHKAYFYVNGTLQNEDGTSFTEGASITFPDNPADIDGKKFQGWTKTQNYSNATDAPSDMTKSATMGDADVTYYAVFATQNGSGTEGYKSVTSFTVGKVYVFGAVKAAASETLKKNQTFGAIAFTNDYNASSPTWGAKVDLTPDEEGFLGTRDVTENCKWTLESISGDHNYAFKKGSKFLYINTTKGSSSAANVGLNTTAQVYIYDATSTCKDAFILRSGNNTSTKMMYNTSNGYRTYENNQTASATMCPYVRFYEYDPGTTYSDYTTSVVTKYDVTFNLQGHGETIASQAIAEGEKVAEPTAPTAIGYTFGGWYKEAECTNAWDFDNEVMGTSDITLYAKWTAINYTITYNNVDGATHSNPATYTIETEAINLADASKDGYIFQGWYDNEDLTGDAVTTIAQGSTGDKTFWAKWTERVKPATPAFSTAAGTIEKGTEVTISCTTENATIYYTTNGDEPTAESTPYSAAITLNTTQTIKAIAILGDMLSEVASAAYTIAQHTAHFSINGVITDDNNCTAAKGEAITFPADPTAPEDHVFIGWKKGGEEVTTPQAEAIATVDKTTEVMGTENVTYYAVWAVGEEGEPTLTKLGSSASFSANDNIVVVATGSDWAKYMYQETVSTSYVSYKDFDGEVSTIADDTKNYFTLSTGTSDGTWKLGDATNGYLYNASSNNLVVSNDNASSWTIAWNSTESKFSIKNGDRWLSCRSDLSGDNQYKFRGGGTSSTSGTVYFDIYKFSNGSYSYSDYSTKVSLDPKPTIVLSATELAEYAGNTNTSITASVSEGAYTGALTVESSAEAVATASISEGTITINALTAGRATITVTAPEVTGFRKNTATIAVTVSEKQAHGLEFSAEVLNLTVGDAEFSEPTLNNPNSLPVVYSLEYATPANEGKVATIDPATGKITLADPSLSTETQGAVTVKASTVGDNSHVAGEVTYNLVVARKVTTTSWSNEGAAVTIDKDEIATLPTASNDGDRNLFYESSNTEVATIDNTGAVTFVAYGTTTITVKTNATAEYAATSATYELTFAPRYTVTFKVYGKDDVVLREETTGAGVTAPAVEPIDDMVFRGWAENEIDGTTDVAPTFVTTSTLDEDKTLYAVFAKKSGTSLDYKFTIEKTALSSSGYSAADGSHNVTATCTTDESKTLTIAYTTSNVYQNASTNPSKLQWKKNDGTLYNTTDLGTITNVTVADASNLNTYYGTAEHPTSGSSVGSGNGYFTISAGSNTGTASSITVAFTKADYIYSHYCTTLPELSVTASNGTTTVTGIVSSSDEVMNGIDDIAEVSSIDMTDAIVSDDVLSAISTDVTGKNILIYAPETSSSTAVNVVVDGTCANLVLTDKVAVNIPGEITATNITYGRGSNLASGSYATVYLPYAFPIGDFKVMKFTGVNGGVVNFQYVDETEPNVPYVIRPNNVDKALLSFNIENESTAVTTNTDKKQDAPRKAARNDVTGFYGTYETLILNGNDGYYGFAGGIFKKANTTSGTKITPFRAYLFIDSNSDARLDSFGFNESDDATRVTEVFEAFEKNEPMYDLNGRRVVTPARGQVVIMRGHKVMFK